MPRFKVLTFDEVIKLGESELAIADKGGERMSENGMITAADEFDFTADSTIEKVTVEWEITAAERRETSTENGEGVMHVLTFESTDWPYPIDIRLFVSYTPKDTSKSVEWVGRQRGLAKQIALAATGEPRYSFEEGDSNYIVGKHVMATTRENNEGFATLGRFRKVS